MDKMSTVIEAQNDFQKVLDEITAWSERHAHLRLTAVLITDEGAFLRGSPGKVISALAMTIHEVAERVEQDIKSE
jgi:hypothetical protein